MKVLAVFLQSPGVEPAVQKVRQCISPLVECDWEGECLYFGEGSSVNPSMFMGFNKLIINEGNFLPYKTEEVLQSILAVVEKKQPQLLVFYDNLSGHEIGVRLSARLECECCTHVQGLSSANDGLLCTAKVYNSNLLGCFKLQGWPLVVTVSRGIDIKDTIDGDCLPMVEHMKQLVCSSYSYILEQKPLAQPIRNPLETAELIFVGGKGLGNKGGFDLLVQTAAKCNAQVGATRAAALSGWCSTEIILGQSGVIAKPKICIAFGVSGAGPFIAGVEGAGQLIAVNHDPDAPIFRYADMGIVADAKSILKELQGVISGGIFKDR